MGDIIVGLPYYMEVGILTEVIQDIKKESEGIGKYINGELKIIAIQDSNQGNSEMDSEEHENIIILEQAENQGIGSSVNSIFTKFLEVAEEGDTLVVMDCDLKQSAKCIKDLLQKRQKEKELNVVICSSLSENENKLRIFINKYTSFIFKSLGVNDYISPYRMYDYRIIKALDIKRKNKGNARIINTNNFLYTIELTYIINKIGGKFGEIPFTYEFNEEKRTKTEELKLIIDILILPIRLKLKFK